MRPLHAALSLLSLGFACAPAAAYEFKDCSSTARDNLRPAANFIRDNMAAMVDGFTFLTEKQRQEISRKWPKIKIDCTDTSSGCEKHSWAGHAHGGPGNQINMCPANMLEWGYNTCRAVGTMMHEMGHAHGFRNTPGHNDEPVSDYVRDNDVMYRMGSSAASFCLTILTSTTTNLAFTGTPRAVLGAACNSNADCQSGNCGAGTCNCNNDGDCPTDEKCFKPAAARNFCSTVNRPRGDACTRNEQCASGKCQGDNCVCDNNNHCPDGQTCFRPVTSPNFCSTTNRPVGDACTRNDQCRSGKCESDRCVCDSDGDCPEQDQTCFRPVTGANFCSSTNRALGSSCTRGDQCSSGKCEDGDCVCARNSDCPDPNNQVCRDSIFKKNFCERR